MINIRTLLISISSFLLLPALIFAEPDEAELEIDLATMEEGASRTETVRIQEDILLTLYVKNLLPSKDYRVTIDTKSETIPAMELVLNKHSNDCAQTYESFKLDLFELQNENEIIVLAEEFRKNLSNYCLASSDRVRYKDSLEKMTEYEVFPKGVKIKPGSEVTITVKRRGESGKDVVRTIVYNAASTEPGGNWKLSYGFAFPVMVSESEKYFSKLSDSLDNKFLISSKKNNDLTKFIPAIFLTWMPNQNLFEEWSYCYTAGLGFDFENPTVFAGGAITYNQKLNLLYGVIAHKLCRLNGRYEKNQIINENLSELQLHEYVYRLNLFLGLSYSF